MKSTILFIATLLALASQVTASPSSMYKDLKKFAKQIPLTKAETHKYHANAPKHLRQNKEHHQQIYDEAHQRTMALRRKLGMKPLGEGAHANV